MTIHQTSINGQSLSLLFDSLPVVERWRSRENVTAQMDRYGQFAHVLSWGIDTVHYQVALDPESMREVLAACDAWIESGRSDIRRGAINHYAFTVTAYDGLVICVPSERGAMADMGLWIVGGAAWCLQYEAVDFEWQIISRISELFRITFEHLNLRLRRVDPRVDFAGEGLDPFCNLENLVCNARKRRQIFGVAEDASPDAGEEDDPISVYGSISRFTGITAGKSDVVCRVYDKVTEADKGTIERWRDVWGGYDGETVWRWEYQLRGDFLKEWDATTMRDFLGKLGDLFDYLLRWLRVAEVQARKDKDRPLVSWWAAITESIQALDLLRCGARRTVLRRVADEDFLKRQAVGIVTSWAARRAYNSGSTDFNFGQIVYEFSLILDEERKRMEEKFSLRVNDLEAWGIT